MSTIKTQDYTKSLTSNGRFITFVHGHYGSGTNEEVFTKMQKDDLLIPSFGQNISYILFTKINPEDQELDEINKFMNKKYLHCGTDIHSFPGDVVFYHDIVHLNERLKNPSKKELEDMLGVKESRGVVYSDDGKLRRVQGSHLIGNLEKGSLGNHAHIIGFSGSEEVAEETNKLASMYDDKPYLWVLQGIDHSTTRFSSLDSNCSLGRRRRLYIYGDYRSNSNGKVGYAFAIQNISKVRSV